MPFEEGPTPVGYTPGGFIVDICRKPRYTATVIRLKKRASRTVAARLHKLTGQLSGVERMLRSRRQCMEVITQLSAVQSGIRKVGAIIIRDEVRRTATSPRARAQLEGLISQLSPL